MPGTQPNEAALLGPINACQGCHGFYDQAVEPFENWQGSMMAHAGRDPVFWAALAIADSDFAGAGDYCIRCHQPRGWHSGRAMPTDGSGLSQTEDHNGIECAICHNMVNPNGLEHEGVQNDPFIANTGGANPEGFYGSGMRVLAGNQTRYGPYDLTAVAPPHPWAKSKFHRDSALCGTCHEVSNPLVGDLADNNGAQIPLAAGEFSGVPGAPVADKAAFKNPPYKYGIVERTYSEHVTSLLSTTPVSDFNLLPADLQRGAIKRAHDQAHARRPRRQLRRRDASHVLVPELPHGAGRRRGRFVRPGAAALRPAAARPDRRQHLGAERHQVARQPVSEQVAPRPGTSSAGMSAAMDRGVIRARQTLQRAGALDVSADNGTLRVTNLTGHKLITGYAEGRRMWLRVRWMDEQLQVLQEDGAYGPFSTTIEGSPVTVNSITDPGARVYEAKMAITQDWALELLGLGVDPLLPLSFDRVTGAVEMDLATLAASPAGSEHETFHFVLNNKFIKDNRIPPYGMDRDTAAARNALPVPETLYGNPAPGGVIRSLRRRCADTATRAPPAPRWNSSTRRRAGSTSSSCCSPTPARTPTSQLPAKSLFDAYMATGQSTPEVMTTTRWCDMPGTDEDVEITTSVNGSTSTETCAKAD